MKLTVHLEGKNRSELANGLKAHLALFEQSEEETDTIDVGALKKAKRTKPAPTVSDDEDEDFGTKPLAAKDLEDDEEDESDVEDQDEVEEPSVTFEELRAAVNKYGEKYPDRMRAILLSFKIKGPKDLASEKNERHWDVVYQKVMAAIKASKKAK